MKHRITYSLCALAISACATGPATVQDFALPTGDRIALVAGTTLQPDCDFYDIDEDMNASNSVCVEFPAGLARADDGADPMSRYAKALADIGLEPTGGATNVMWFKVPVEPGCRQSLNLVAVPKTKPAADDVWDVETGVIAFVAEPKRC